MKVTAIVIGGLLLLGLIAIPVFAQWGPGNEFRGYDNRHRGFNGPGYHAYAPRIDEPCDYYGDRSFGQPNGYHRRGRGFNGHGRMMDWDGGHGFHRGGHMMGRGFGG